MFQQMMASLLGTQRQLEGGRVLRREGSGPAGGSKLGGLLWPMLRASVAVVAFVTLPALSAGINDTGITDVRDGNGDLTSCADGSSYPRQDGCRGRDQQAGAGTLSKTGGGRKGFDFTKIYDNGNWACTQDNVTGLTWEVKTQSSGLHDQSNTYTWYQGDTGVPNGGSCSGGSGCDTTKFVAAVNAAGLCGANDWRMPTVKELEGLVDYGFFLRDRKPFIDPTFFPDTPTDRAFWTGVIDAASSGYSWFVDFEDGGNGRDQFMAKKHVRLVRGTANPNQFVLTDNGLTVTDNSTGLMWKRDYEMRVPGQPQSPDSLTPDWFIWSEALTRSISDRTAGYSDWRVPSVRELRSLVDDSVGSPSINKSFFPATIPGAYFWSSSPTFDFNWNAMVWNVNFDYGNDGRTPPYFSNYVRLVRDGAGTAVAAQHALRVTRSGAGSGAVVSNPGGINCGPLCNSSFYEGSNVMLSAAADAGSIFSGWSGASCSGTGICTVSMTQAQSVTANFDISTNPGHTLSVTTSGTGFGSVSGSGISCGNVCSLVYPSSTSVTLTAIADSVSGFDGWNGGGCSGKGTCTVNMDQARNVTAIFTLVSGSGNSYKLDVTKSGAGSGKVVSNPVGIDCGPQCSTTSGTSVTLSATADVGSIFTGWSGGGCSGTGFCTVIMSEAQSVIATFTPPSGYPLSVTPLGTGSGTVVSSPAGINCSPSCNSQFSTGASVVLTATANAGSTFARWTGGGCSGTGTCTVSMNQAQNVIATFNSGSVASYALSVTKSGTGSGTVTSFPVGFNCGTVCSMNYPSGTSVTLGATASAGGSTFTGWSGGGCSGTFHCTVSMNQAHNVIATFSSGSVASYALSVTKLGTGSGRLISSPAGIDCGTSCSTQFPSSTSITLSTTTNAGSTFTGWGGACSGTATCTVSMNQARSVTATFSSGTAASYAINVTKSGTGSGKVVSLPAGIDCGTACSTQFPNGASVTLGASPNAGSTFTGWSGGGCSGTFLCTVSMNQAQSVTATFSIPGYTLLSVTKSGTGSGTVVSSAAGINCGAVCSAGYPGDASVRLTATAVSGSTFSGWSGACSGLDTCTVSMSQAQSVTAKFTLVTVSSANPYDGIYQWDTGNYLSLHQTGGGTLIGSIYWVYTATTEQVGKRIISQSDTFDLLQGQIAGSSATMSGTRFYRACTVSYDFTFNRDSSLTVRLTSVSNTLGVAPADVDCAARYNPVGTVSTIPRIF